MPRGNSTPSNVVRKPPNRQLLKLIFVKFATTNIDYPTRQKNYFLHSCRLVFFFVKLKILRKRNKK